MLSATSDRLAAGIRRGARALRQSEIHLLEATIARATVRNELTGTRSTDQTHSPTPS
jgi:hypothetical protein